MTVLLDIEAFGWRYSPPPAGTAWHDDPLYDDSAWAVGQSRFGFPVGGTVHTLWPGGAFSSLAIRRLLGPGSYSGAELLVGADDSAQVWLNGVLIATKPSPASEGTFIIPNGAWGGDNLLAVLGVDDLGIERVIYVGITVPDRGHLGSIKGLLP